MSAGRRSLHGLVRRAVAILALLAFPLAACGGMGATDDLFGEELVAQVCSRCHGGDLEGGIGPPLGPGSNAATNLTDEQIAGVLDVGPGAMPSFKNLSDEQVAGLIAFLRTVQAGG